MHLSVAVIATVMFSACALVRMQGLASGQMGPGVERSIDIQFQPLLRSYDRGIHVGHATCPTFIELSGGKTGRCTLPVGQASLPIIVTPGKTLDTYNLQAAAVVVSMRVTEEYLTRSVTSGYGVRSIVECGNPRVRVVPVGTRLSCRLRGTGLPRSIAFKVTNLAGQVFVYDLSHRTTLVNKLLGPYLHKHRIGGLDLVPGHVLEEGVHALFVAGDSTGEAVRNGFTVHCPNPSDLTGNRHVNCTIAARPGTGLIDVWIDATQTLQVLSRRGFLDTKRIESAAKQYYQDKLLAANLAHAVAVDCGPQRVVTITGATRIKCTVEYGTGPRPLTVSYPDYPKGGIQFFIPPR